MDVLEYFFPYKGFETLYLVSNKGRIWSLKSGRLLRPSKPNGYPQVTLFASGGTHYRRVHQMVVETFLPAPTSAQTEVNHIDGVRDNNTVNCVVVDEKLIVLEEGTNLEWCSHTENCNNPNTKSTGWHYSEESKKRQSEAQKKRFREHPETYGRWRNDFGFKRT